MDSLARTVSDATRFRVHKASDLLKIVGGVLRGELLRVDGRFDAAARAFEEAERVEHGLMYDEPEPLPFKVADYLGALRLEQGHPEEAVRVYEAALVARPNNGWSLVGLQRALRESGRVEAADDAHERYVRTWARADGPLATSRF